MVFPEASPPTKKNKRRSCNSESVEIAVKRELVRNAMTRQCTAYAVGVKEIHNTKKEAKNIHGGVACRFTPRKRERKDPSLVAFKVSSNF